MKLKDRMYMAGIEAQSYRRLLFPLYMIVGGLVVLGFGVGILFGHDEAQFLTIPVIQLKHFLNMTS